MATLVRLSREQIDKLFEEMAELENRMKEMHEELERVGVPSETLARFSRLHNRYSSNVAFLVRQRQLGRTKDA